jgi:hypothetical protein
VARRAASRPTISSCTCSGACGGDRERSRLVQIPFSSLKNGTATFDRTEIWSIEFQPGAGAVAVWRDDLSFY